VVTESERFDVILAKARKVAKENDLPELTALVEKWDYEDANCEDCAHTRWLHRSAGEPFGCITCGCTRYIYEPE
jgi:hypothetical protein